jgi:hypothetical protein
MDNWTKRSVVIILGILAVAGLAIGGTLSFYERAVPDFIIGTTATAVGALAGLVMQRSIVTEEQ